MSNRSRTLWLLAALLLVAANLRAPVTAVAPVLSRLQTEFSLSSAQAGLLTTLPLLAFGLVSPFAAAIARARGLERTVLAALAVIAVGILLRSAGALSALYAGTLLAGMGIAVGNVLLPSIIKRDFPGSVALVTSACALAMGGVAAVASASAVPLAGAGGWQWALGSLLVLPVAAMLAWRVQLSGPAIRVQAGAHLSVPVWRSALAWQLTLFMGLNSTLYYATVAWLPAVLAEAGYSASAAGSVHGVMQLASALPGLVLAPLVARCKDQKLLAAGAGLLMALAVFGLARWPALAALWAVCLGAGSGAGLILALMFMGLRAANAPTAAALSGMAQCLGYLLAASGPLLAGKAYAWSHGWTWPLHVGVVLCLAMALFGALAGRARLLGEAVLPSAQKQE
ncbi:MFS transporter [Bordetella genomosp. 12]|uniref:MFS transporter n=1 Tax=Bordetella genomosp. 12 TaxID=463035 RepID=A0A261VMV9_9BORD|nr:MFS transporter [Bordetella genomosp. 12]OZI75081.1 MFS transporter [Bordetella genomosp. 12]